MAPRVFIVMAVFRPDPGYLDRQLETLAGQSVTDLCLLAVIADESVQTRDLVRDLCARHGVSLHLHDPGLRLDAPHAFEAGLAAALPLCEAARAEGAEPFIALCDQDDLWHPDRIARGIAALSGGALLCHSDARVIAADETPLAPSMFALERRDPAPGLRGLLYRNTVTGMTVTLRPELAELAVPFPPQNGAHFHHDLWLALLAQARDGMVFLDEALVDYRQHGGNAVGAITAEVRVARRMRPGKAWLVREVQLYALARYLAHVLVKRLEQGVQDGRLHDDGITRRVRRRLRAFLARSGGVAVFLADTVTRLARGRVKAARGPLGYAIAALARGTWSVKRALTEGRRVALQRFDMTFYAASPGVYPDMPEFETEEDTGGQDFSALVDWRKVPKWRPEFSAREASVCVLIPSLNPGEMFAGLASALDLGLGLAERGHRVRFIATDMALAVPEATRNFLRRRLQDDGAMARIELACGVTQEVLAAHRDDIFLATAWWTAHVAHRLTAEYGYASQRMIYLIQDYEPGFYPWGPEHADAEASYGFDILPVFNTTLLRDHFAARGHGFASPDALCFHPMIDIARYAATPRKPASPRRLLLYGRPDVARNMFATAIEALAGFIRDSDLHPDEIEVISVGLPHDPVTLPNGVVLESRGKIAWEAYPAFLASADVGLALMLSPHPSHLPLEMAASGQRVVTNCYGPKDLSVLTPAILSEPPVAPDLAQALTQAWQLPPVTEAERHFSLAPLGDPPARVMDALSARLSAAPVPQRRRVILHIGAPKCGSTYLQQVLRRNRDSLACQGIAYPHDGGAHPGNAAGIGDLDAVGLDALFAGGMQVVILSHEDLFGRAEAARAFFDLCRRQEIEVQVLCLLRPITDIIFGDYSQAMKQGFERFVDSRTPYDGMDFEAFVRMRREKLLPVQFLDGYRVINAGRAPMVASAASLRATVEGLIGAQAIADWDVPRDAVNPSISAADCDALSCAIADRATPEASLREMLRDALKRAASRAPDAPDPGRSAARIDLIERLFADEIEALAEGYGFDAYAVQAARITS